MALFDKLKQAAGQIADSASRQTGVMKLQSQLGALETEIERTYAEAGKRARQLYRERQLLDNEIGVIMERIDALEAELQQLRQRVHDLQQPAPVQQAPQAPVPQSPGAAAPQTPTAQAPVAPATPAPPAPIPQSAQGQPAQGPPQAFQPPQTPPAVTQPQPSPETVLCPHCGHQIEDDARFCESCGGKLVEG